MDIVLIFNGLGNQMSQYAFSMSKKLHNPRCMVTFDPASQIIHNGYELEKVFGIKIPRTFTGRAVLLMYRICNRFKITRLVKVCGMNIIREPLSYAYNEDYLRKGHAIVNIYWGGWHSEKYFKHLRAQILDRFKFPIVVNDTDDDIRYNNLLQKISDEDNSVSVHIRRGDYLTEPENTPYNYYQCGENYYFKAIQYLRNKYSNLKIYIFSNDMEWCRRVFVGDDYTFIDFNNGCNSWRDMSLMSKCRHHVIANSTFSWWGAWLCQREGGKTIRPPKFLTNIDTPDFYPEDWIVIDPQEYE